MGLLYTVLGLIFMSGDVVKDDVLFGFLTQVGVYEDEAPTRRPADISVRPDIKELFGDVRNLVFKEWGQKQHYLDIKKVFPILKAMILMIRLILTLISGWFQWHGQPELWDSLGRASQTRSEEKFRTEHYLWNVQRETKALQRTVWKSPSRGTRCLQGRCGQFRKISLAGERTECDIFHLAMLW